MVKFKKIGFILLLICFVIVFPSIGIYIANKVREVVGNHRTMTGSIIQIGWIWRGAMGGWMTLMIMIIDKLKISRDTKYIAMLMAVVINIAFMFITEDLWFFTFPFFQFLWIIANLIVLFPIIVDKMIAAKISEEDDDHTGS